MMVKKIISGSVVASLLILTTPNVQASALANGCTSELCSKKLNKLSKLAKNGSPHAMALMGVFYFHGDGVELDYAKAAKWFKRATRKYSPQAEYYLSLMYKEGLHVEVDAEKAAKYLDSASEAGFVLALVDKGVDAYVNQSKDLSIAYNYFTQASALNSAKATYLLAKMTELGQGTNTDLSKAQSLYQLAATKGYRDSRAHYARLANKTNDKSMQASVEHEHEIDSNIERIEVLGGNFTMETHLDFIIGDITKQKVYNSKSTGRIRGQACDKWANPPCSSLVDEDRILNIARK